MLRVHESVEVERWGGDKFLWEVQTVSLFIFVQLLNIFSTA